MLIKYFSAKVNPALHDLSAVREGFGMWHEGFIHAEYQKKLQSSEEKLQREKLQDQSQVFSTSPTTQHILSRQSSRNVSSRPASPSFLQFLKKEEVKVATKEEEELQYVG